MKTCVVKRRLWALEADNATIQIDTEPGFGTPKACIIQYVETSATTDALDSTLAHRNMGIGFVGPAGDGTTTLRLQTCWMTMADNVATRAGARQNSNTAACYAHSSDRATTYYRATSAGFGTDLMTLTFANTTPQSNGHLDAIFTFFGGDDITVGVGTIPVATTGQTIVSTLNFQPDVVLVASTITALNAGDTTDARLSWGCATRSPALNRAVGFHAELGVTTSDMATVYSSNDAAAWYTNTVTGPFFNQITNFTSSGFEITGGQTTNLALMLYLAIKGFSPTHFALRELSTATSTGNQFTGLGSTGFVPKTVIGGVVNGFSDGTRTGMTTSPQSECICLFAGNRTADTLYFNGAGTIQTNSAGTAVTGTSTFFYRLAPGFKIYETNNTLIGTVSTVTSNTALTLTSNAASTLAAGTSFVYSNQGQYSMSMGDSDGSSANSTVFSRSSSALIHLSSTSTGSTFIEADLNNFDTRPGFEINFLTVSGVARKGWILAFENTDNANEARRRTDKHY